MEIKKNKLKKQTLIIIISIVAILLALVLVVQKSPFSIKKPGISVQEDANLSPSSPTKLVVKQVEAAKLLTWLGTGDDRISYYQIYIKSTKGGWEKYSQVSAKGDNRGNYESYIPSSKTINVTGYAVSAINRYGKESLLTEVTN